MSKSKEELNALKERIETVSKEIRELTPEELEQVTGGVGVMNEKLDKAINSTAAVFSIYGTQSVFSIYGTQPFSSINGTQPFCSINGTRPIENITIELD